MKILIVCLVMNGIFLKNTASAQNNAQHSDNRLNAVTINAFSYSTFSSIQYERLFAIQSIGQFTGFVSVVAGAGLSGSLSLRSDRSNVSYFSLPHHLTYNIGFKPLLSRFDPLYLEMGMGGAVIYDYKNQYFIMTGLRLHSLQQHRVQLRVYFQLPLTEFGEELLILNWGWGIGINF